MESKLPDDRSVMSYLWKQSHNEPTEATPEMPAALRDLAGRLWLAAEALDGKKQFTDAASWQHPAVRQAISMLEAALKEIRKDSLVLDRMTERERHPVERMKIEMRGDGWMNDYFRVILAGELLTGRPLSDGKKVCGLPCGVCLGVIGKEEAEKLFEKSALIWREEMLGGQNGKEAGGEREHPGPVADGVASATA